MFTSKILAWLETPCLQSRFWHQPPMEGKGKHNTIQNMRVSLGKKPFSAVTELSKHYIIACYHYHHHLHHYFRERGQEMQTFGGEREHNTFKDLKKNFWAAQGWWDIGLKRSVADNPWRAWALRSHWWVINAPCIRSYYHSLDFFLNRILLSNLSSPLSLLTYPHDSSLNFPLFLQQASH